MGWWPWRRKGPTADQQYSVSDPSLVARLGWAGPVLAGVEVTESTALGASPFFRAVSLISATIGMLPMPTVRVIDATARLQIRSWLDTPGGADGPTPMEWKETVAAHLVIHGDAFLIHRYNQAGGIYALEPVHPLCVGVDWWTPQTGMPRPPGGKLYTVALADGTSETLTARTLTHIPALSLDGLRGVSLLRVARQSLGASIAGDRAAARVFGEGNLLRGVLTPADDDLDPDEAAAYSEELRRDTAGWEHAAAVRVLTRKLTFTPWSMTLADAQFLESRAFQVEEVSRWTGIPPHLLMQTDKQTSWGTGVAEQNRAMARTVIAPWATRIEQRLSRLLPAPRVVEFDFHALERPNPEVEIALLIQQLQAGILTRDEVRARRGLPPLGDQAAPAGERVPATPEGVLA